MGRWGRAAQWRKAGHLLRGAGLGGSNEVKRVRRKAGVEKKVGLVVVQRACWCL